MSDEKANRLRMAAQQRSRSPKRLCFQPSGGVEPQVKDWVQPTPSLSSTEKTSGDVDKPDSITSATSSLLDVLCAYPVFAGMLAEFLWGLQATGETKDHLIFPGDCLTRQMQNEVPVRACLGWQRDPITLQVEQKEMALVKLLGASSTICDIVVLGVKYGRILASARAAAAPSISASADLRLVSSICGTLQHSHAKSWKRVRPLQPRPTTEAETAMAKQSSFLAAARLVQKRREEMVKQKSAELLALERELLYAPLSGPSFAPEDQRVLDKILNLIRTTFAPMVAMGVPITCLELCKAACVDDNGMTGKKVLEALDVLHDINKVYRIGGIFFHL